MSELRQHLSVAEARTAEEAKRASTAETKARGVAELRQRCLAAQRNIDELLAAKRARWKRRVSYALHFSVPNCLLPC